MVIRAYDPVFQIRELAIKKDGGEISLSWRFKEATHFLVFLYDSRKEFALGDILKEISECGVTDEDIIRNSSSQRNYNYKGEWLKVFCFREKDFVTNGKKYFIKGSEAKRGIPYTAKVYVCQYDNKEKTLYVYETADERNETFLPVTVEPEIRYKRMGVLPGNSKRICILKLPCLEGYMNGAIMYHVDGISVDFPLAQGCLGKELVIVIPAKSEVSIRIREEYKKYYKKV